MSSEQLEELMIMLYIKRNKLSSIRPFFNYCYLYIKKARRVRAYFIMEQ